MNLLKFFILPFVLQIRLSTAQSLFNVIEQPYIEYAENLTSIAALEDFYEAQCSIYVDNVYAVYERFFYRLLSELPKSRRTQQLKEMTLKIEQLLAIEDYRKKMLMFDEFIKKYALHFESLFEYDAAETLLDAAQFNDLYVECHVEEVLNYANAEQLMSFVHFTGDGIRLFLILQRSRLSKEQIMQFKEIVDEFLEKEKFVEKRESLKLFLHRCYQFLDY